MKRAKLFWQSAKKSEEIVNKSKIKTQLNNPTRNPIDHSPPKRDRPTDQLEKGRRLFFTNECVNNKAPKAAAVTKKRKGSLEQQQRKDRVCEGESEAKNQYGESLN